VIASSECIGLLDSEREGVDSYLVFQTGMLARSRETVPSDSAASQRGRKSEVRFKSGTVPQP